MEHKLNVISTGASGCGSCSSSGCGTCGSDSTSAEPAPKLSRRELGLAALAASSGLALTRFSQAQSKTAAAAPAQKPEPVPLSEDLNVVQKGKGPIMTVLDEFYKMG